VVKADSDLLDLQVLRMLGCLGARDEVVHNTVAAACRVTGECAVEVAREAAVEDAHVCRAATGEETATGGVDLFILAATGGRKQFRQRCTTQQQDRVNWINITRLCC
jgi:hypothetical protein